MHPTAPKATKAKKITATVLSIVGIVALAVAIAIIANTHQNLDIRNRAATTTTSCSVAFDNKDTLFCEKNSTQVTASGTILLAPAGSTLQKQWYIVNPPSKKTQPIYTTEPAVTGNRFSITATWPGISSGDTTVEIHWGVNILDSNGNPVSPPCTGTLDYFWTQANAAACTSATSTPTHAPTATPTKTQQSNSLLPTSTPTPTLTNQAKSSTITPTSTQSSGNAVGPTPTQTSSQNNGSGNTSQTNITPTPGGDALADSALNAQNSDPKVASATELMKSGNEQPLIWFGAIAMFCILVGIVFLHIS